MTTSVATGRLSAFTNEPITDFTLPTNRAAAEAALARVRAEMGQNYELWIAGASHKTGDLLTSVNPSKSSGSGGQASQGHARACYLSHRGRPRVLPRMELLRPGRTPHRTRRPRRLDHS